MIGKLYIQIESSFPTIEESLKWLQPLADSIQPSDGSTAGKSPTRWLVAAITTAAGSGWKAHGQFNRTQAAIGHPSINRFAICYAAGASRRCAVSGAGASARRMN